MEKELGRIKYIDGLKVIMAIAVVFTHYMLAFYPNGYVGFGSGVNEGIKKCIRGGMPWSLISNSSISLYLFFAMISFVIAVNYREKQSDISVIQKQAVGRYFQFLIPVFAATFLAFVLYETGFLRYEQVAAMTGTPWSLSIRPTTHSFGLMLLYGIIGIYFNNNVEFLTVLWCMHVIFIGSMLTYAIMALFGNLRYKYICCIMFMIVGLIFPQYLVFAVGVISGEIYNYVRYRELEGWKINLAGICMICTGIAIGMIPSVYLPKYINLYISYAAGSLLILCGVVICRPVQKLLSWKGFMILRGQEFSIILVHIFVLYSFSAWLYKLLLQFIHNNQLCFLFTFLISLPVIALGAIIFNILFEKPSRRLSKRVSGILMTEKA